MTAAAVAAQLLAWVVLAPVLPGVITRTRSMWAGRRGPPVLQLAYDVARLLRKTPVYSTTTTPVFRLAPWVALGAALAASLVVPFGAGAAWPFPGDFVFFAHAWALGRVALMLGALDTGSAFEGMGASREATLSTLLEPVLFLIVGAVGLAAGADTLAELGAFWPSDVAGWMVWGVCVVGLLVVVQVESSRMPVDDPTTHLELTMIHEVMILDHSGPDLAALQYGAALKLVTGVSLLTALLLPAPANPWILVGGPHPWLAWVAHLVGCLAVAAGIGTIESLTARLRMGAVPMYILVALGASALVVLLAARSGA